MSFAIENYLNLTTSFFKDINNNKKEIEKMFFIPSYDYIYKKTEYSEVIFNLLNDFTIDNYKDNIKKALDICNIAIKKDEINKDLYIYSKSICYLNQKDYKKAYNLLKGVNKKYIFTCGDEVYLKYCLAFGEINYMKKNYAEALNAINNNEKIIDKSTDASNIFIAINIYFENNEFDKMYECCEKILNNPEKYENFNFYKEIKLLVLMSFYTEHFRINFLTRSTLLKLARKLDFDLNENNLKTYIESLKVYFTHITKSYLTDNEIKYFNAIEKTMSDLLVPTPKGEKLYSPIEETIYASKIINKEYKEVFEALAK